MTSKLKRKLYETFKNKLTEELDLVTLMKFMEDIDNGLTFNEAIKKHIDLLSQETLDLLTPIQKQIIREREEKRLLESVRNEIKYKQIEETQRIKREKENRQRVLTTDKVRRRNLIDMHNQIAMALWEQKDLVSVVNPVGKGQYGDMGFKTEGQLIWSYITFYEDNKLKQKLWYSKNKVLLLGSLHIAYVQQKIGTHYYKRGKDPRKTALKIREGKVKPFKTEILDNPHYTYGELLSLLEPNETLSVVVYGSYRRRDPDNDAIHLNFKSNKSWLTIKVKHPSRLPNGMEVIQNNGVFKLLISITKNTEFMRKPIVETIQDGVIYEVDGLGMKIVS